jgi:hypothetical protein
MLRQAWLLVFACSVIATTAFTAASPAHAESGVLTEAMLQNMTYPSEITAGRVAPLRDGKYEEPAASGSASKTTVAFVQSAISEDFAAVILASSAGGTGTFYTLHVVTESAGAATAGPGLQIGDRIRVNSVAIAGNTVRIGMTVHGPADPACCPSLSATREFVRNGGVFAAGQSATVTAPAPPNTGNAGLATPASSLAVAVFTVLAGVLVLVSRRLASRGSSA